MTAPPVGRLELKYEITRMSVLYEEAAKSWGDAEFTSGKDFTGTLRLWEDGLEPEHLIGVWKRLEERASTFHIAEKFRGNHSIELKGERAIYYYNEREFILRDESEIPHIVKIIRSENNSYNYCMGNLPLCAFNGFGYSPPAPLPQNMPCIPGDLHWMAETLVLAEKQSEHTDLMIKLAYLVLEVLEQCPPDDLRYVRNFVSHPICRDDGVIALVMEDLPSAKVTDGVQFRRNNKDHIAFVSKYAYPTLQRAKELFSEKVKAEGGFL